MSTTSFFNGAIGLSGDVSVSEGNSSSALVVRSVFLNDEAHVDDPNNPKVLSLAKFRPSIEDNITATFYNILSDSTDINTQLTGADNKVSEYTQFSTTSVDADFPGLSIGYRSTNGTANVGNDNRYNFYAEGSAPNFLKGTTYIGGNTTRNTRELWKSTLTEEQLEQLEAGTLAVPANVLYSW